MRGSVGRTRESDRLVESVIANPSMAEFSEESGLFLVEGWRGLRGRSRKSGPRLLFRDTAPNTVVNQGLIYKMGSALLGTTPITSWFVMLISATPTIAVGDTYASHAGWTEETDYDETTREAWIGVATGTAGEASNTASRAEFTVSVGGMDIGGCAFVGGGSAPSTKGDTAGGGTLLSAAAFSGGDRSLLESDVLRVTYIQRSQRPA